MVAHPSGAWFRSVRLHWGSKSISRILNFLFLRSIPAARFCTVVVLPTPPLLLTMANIIFNLLSIFSPIIFYKDAAKIRFNIHTNKLFCKFVCMTTNYFSNMFAFLHPIKQTFRHFWKQTFTFANWQINLQLHLQTCMDSFNTACKIVWMQNCCFASMQTRKHVGFTRIQIKSIRKLRVFWYFICT